jgi:hydroxymethylglutaryl-CoA synthase
MAEDGRTRIGIGDMAVYVPRLEMDVARLVAARMRAQPELGPHLERARQTTGQVVVRFPASWEDTATMAAQAVRELLLRGGSPELASLRYLAVGTETTLDHSKPVSSYVQGMLMDAGVRLPSTLTNFQVQHACAGGTLSLLGVASLLALSRNPTDTGIVMAADIARYDAETTAEITQGAGAAAVVVERNPRLLELDIGSAGYCSMPVDDFFRPVGSMTAKVKGQYSIQCYRRSLEDAFLDHCARKGVGPREELLGTDYFVLHVPFRHMPAVALAKLLHSQLGLDRGQVEEFLAERHLDAAVDPISMVGNTYSASLFLSLAFLLESELCRIGPAIVGKRILLASYGSGNTMVVVEAVVARQAPEVIAAWNVSGIITGSEEASLAEYEEWMERNGNGEGAGEAGAAMVPPESFYLKGIREDGYREYSYAPTREHREAQGETSRDLHANVALRS